MLQADALEGAHSHRAGVLLLECLEERNIRKLINFVENQQHRLLTAAHIRQHGLHRVDVFLGLAAAGIYHMHQQPGPACLLKG